MRHAVVKTREGFWIDGRERWNPGPYRELAGLLDATDKQQDYQISRQGASCTALCDGAGLRCARRGGDTYYALLQALPAAEDFGPAALVDVDELPGEGLIMPRGGVGAPLVGLEKDRGGR